MLRSVIATSLLLVACGGGEAPTYVTIGADAGSAASSDPGATSTLTPAACDKDFVMCRDGAEYVSRAGPSCELPACDPIGGGCNQIGIPCPDGSFPTSMRNTDCGRICAPVSCETLSRQAVNVLRSAVEERRTCGADEDCATVELSADCVDTCTRSMTKASTSALDTAKALVNRTACRQFLAQGCSFDRPPCDPPPAPKCVDHTCQ